MVDTFKTLYKKDSKGKTRVWQIGVEDLGTRSEIVIKSGLLDGKQTTQTIVVSCGKNIGKANETTHFEQAVKETEARIVAQEKDGYVDDLKNLRDSGVAGSGQLKPMLAQKYDPTRKQKGSKDLVQLKLHGKEVAVQPKLDGNRCLITLTPMSGQMWTRTGTLMPVQLRHILVPLIARMAQHQIPEVTLDGELYDHEGMTFDELNGLVKKVDATEEQRVKRATIKYHLYDVMLPVGFELRHKFITNYFSSVMNTELVRTDFVPAVEHELYLWLEGVVKQGYEGLIVRKLGIPYENKRTWQLLKYKQFEDEEFKLVDFEEDKRGGFVAAFVMQLPEPVTDRDGKIITTFKAGASGQNQAKRKYMWEHPSEFLGKVATIKFFGRSQYGVPRFGKFKGFV